MANSYKVEVKTGTDPKWYDNAVRWPTMADAEHAAHNLAVRWTAVSDYRAVESADPPNR